MTIDQDTRNAITSMTSVHINATIDGGGNPVSMDMSLGTTGNCEGSVTSGGYKLDVIAASGAYFLRAPGSYWSTTGVPADKLSLVADKWIAGVDASQFENFCDLPAMMASLTDGAIDDDEPKVVGTDVVDGVPAVKLQVRGDSGTNTIYVAASSPHYALKFVSDDGKNTMDFTAINQPVTPSAPADAVDVNSLR